MRIFLAFAVLTSFFLILLGINRGFDVSDEGLYLLLLKPQQSNYAGIYNYDLFFKLLYKISGTEFGVVGARLLRLISYVFAALSITFFWKNLRDDTKLDWDFGMIFLLVFFGGYAFLPPSLSYNSLSVVLASFWLALVSKRKPNAATIILLGTVLAIMVYVKITSAMSLGLITLGIWIWRNQLRWKSLLQLTFPIVLIEITLHVFLGESAWYRFRETWTMIASRPDYQWGLIIKYNLVGAFWVMIVALPAWSINKFPPKYKYIALVLLLMLIGLVFFKTLITDEWSHIFLLITAALIAYLMGKTDWQAISTYQIQLLLVLLILPFALHIGSNVYWLRLGIHYWVFWVIALLFLSLSYKVPHLYLKIVLPTIVCILVFNGIWWKPFGSVALWYFNSPWEYSPGKNILLTPEMCETLGDVQVNLKGIPDSEVIAVYRNPGWLYLLDLTSPHSPGFWDKEQLQTVYPDFPKGFRCVLYFPYQELPSSRHQEFDIKEYSIAQSQLNLLLRKENY